MRLPELAYLRVPDRILVAPNHDRQQVAVRVMLGDPRDMTPDGEQVRVA